MRQRLVDWIATGAMLMAVPVLLFVLAGSTAAARPGESSVWVVEFGEASRSVIGHGDSFTVGFSTREREPWAKASCHPNETTQYSGTHASGAVWEAVFSVYPGGPTPQSFVLGASVNPLWTGGGADCEVLLLTYSRNLQRTTVLAETRFTAAP